MRDPLAAFGLAALLLLLVLLTLAIGFLVPVVAGFSIL